MKVLNIAFDVDGTLVKMMDSKRDEPRWEIIVILKTLHKLGHRIIVWSGGGRDYAEYWVRQLFLEEFVDEVRAKPVGSRKDVCDICFDDEEVVFGKVNAQV